MMNETTKNTGMAMDRQGFAMVTTLLIVLVMSVLAVGIAWLASSEKKMSFAESVHITSVFSADAGGESGINFIRMSDTPPQIIDFADRTVRTQAETVIAGSQTYDYECRYLQKRPRPGWGVNFKDYDYRIASHGEASLKGESGVQLVTSRLFKEGY